MDDVLARIEQQKEDAYHLARDRYVTEPEEEEMTDRTILIHLNVSVPENDTRDYADIVKAVEGAIEVGAYGDEMEGLTVDVAMAEEV